MILELTHRTSVRITAPFVDDAGDPFNPTTVTFTAYNSSGGVVETFTAGTDEEVVECGDTTVGTYALIWTPPERETYRVVVEGSWVGPDVQPRYVAGMIEIKET